jgi:hypothetical protein
MPFFRDFYGNYLEDALHHLRFTQAAPLLLFEDELLEVLGRGFVAVHERAANRAGKPRWADKAPKNVLYTDARQRLRGCEWPLVHVVRNPIDTLFSMPEARFPLTLPAGLENRIAFYTQYLEDCDLAGTAQTGTTLWSTISCVRNPSTLLQACGVGVGSASILVSWPSTKSHEVTGSRTSRSSSQKESTLRASADGKPTLRNRVLR